MDIRSHLEDFLAAEIGGAHLHNRYLLAVSGGLDSMALLELFASILPAEKLVVAHYQHGLRGLEAEGDALFVEATAARLGIAFALGRRPPGASDEASLRRDRRDFLEKQRQENRCDWIVTAHHADDQFETLVMRLLRGTGIEGLQGIFPVRGAWIRPLLSVSRAALQNYTQTSAIEFRADASNDSALYLRNRIRQTLVPTFATLSEEYGGREAFLERVGALVQEARESEQAHSEKTRAIFVHLGTLTPFWLRFNKDLLQRLPDFWRRRVFRLGLERLGVPTLDRADLDRLLRTADSAFPAANFAGFRFMQSCGYLYLQTAEQTMYARQPRRICVEGSQVSLPELETSFTFEGQGGEIRFFQPGDRMGGKKLKEIFLLHRIPQPERRLVPLCAERGGSEIRWIFPQIRAGIEITANRFPFAASLRSLEDYIRT